MSRDSIYHVPCGTVRTVSRLPVVALSVSLGLFFAITFTLCVVFDLAMPSMAMREAWMPLLPGFTWLSLPSYLLGLAESFAYGLYTGIVFGLIFNLCARMGGQGSQ